MYSAFALGFDLVALTVVRRTKEEGHLAAHGLTVAVAVFRSDMIVPGPGYLSQLVDSRLPARPHLASCCADVPKEPFMRISKATSPRGDIGHAPAAFLILIGESVALGAPGSTNRAVVVAVADSREDCLIQAGGRRATMSEPVVVPGRIAVVAVTIVVVVAVWAQDHRPARESRLP